MEHLLGPMAESMLESLLGIKKKVMVASHGQMEESMMEAGVMENSTGKVSTLHLNKKSKLAVGAKARGLHG